MNIKLDGFGRKKRLAGFPVFDNLIEGADDKLCDRVKLKRFFLDFDQH